ncbi:MAG: acyl-CoA carboxylase subunit beta [Planctomycetes bacterium]|nr:acyl-CoA carboxylase subunit beta [Planctomycetota bacterium]
MNTQADLPTSSPRSQTPGWDELLQSIREQREQIAQGGGEQAIERQHKKNRMTARERIAALIDPGTEFFELGRFAAWEMYQEWGSAPAAGVVCGLARVAGRSFMLIANDATVKAGSFFPQTAKKVLRAQRIALVNRLPLIYLVDSSGVFLPLQEDVFPDEDDFGRIFRNNAVLSALGVSQLAAIMGNCVAGGGYLPVLCDKLVMTDGSGLYLAGPALVKSSIGQDVSHEELGGAEMHAAVSGTIDFREPNDEACLKRLRSLAAAIPEDVQASQFRREESVPPSRPTEDISQVFPVNPQQEYEVRDLLDCLVDASSFQEYKAEYGKTMICGYARIGGFSVGIVTNQHHSEKTETAGLQFGGVIYHDGADKTARFVMDCNQTWTPLLFLQDVYGFMVGRDSEQAGIIKAGAKLVNVISNSRVPKITLIMGGSYGAGHYAMCGKAFDPRFLFAWPTARYAVMGSQQAAKTVLDINIAALKRAGQIPDAEELEKLRQTIVDTYENQTDIRYAAARGWVDEIIEPAQTRSALITALEIATRHADDEPFRTGVLQV